MAIRRPAAFSIDDFWIDPSQNAIVHAGTSHPIEPKVMDVLCFLAEHHGEVVTRQDIIDGVWGVAFGGDESLTRAISRLRKVFETGSGGTEIIKTVSKRGYCLNGIKGDFDGPALPIGQSNGVSAKPNWRLVAGAGLLGLIVVLIGVALMTIGGGRRSVHDGIVVTISQISGDSSQAISEKLLASLSHFNGITVRKAGGSQQTGDYSYEITGELESAHLSVRLTDKVTGNAVWSGEVDTAENARAATARLAAQIDGAVRTAAKTTIASKPPERLSPWELVLLGSWVPGTELPPPEPPNENAYWVYKRAIALDPHYAPTYAALAEALAYHALFDPPSDTAPQTARSLTNANRSLELAPYDARVLYHVAQYYRFSGQRAASSAMLQRVVDIEPDNLIAQADLAFVNGQCTDQSTSAITTLQKLDGSLAAADPAHWVILSHLADLSLARGEYAAAHDYATRSRAIVRQVWSSITLAASAAELGDKTEARTIGLEARNQWPALDYNHFADIPLKRWCLGGNIDHARDAFGKLAGLTKTTASAPR